MLEGKMARKGKIGDKMTGDNRFVTVSLLFFCLSLTQVRAEEILTWKACVKEAKENHPELISAKEKLNKARAGRVSAASSKLPQISGRLSGNTSGTDADEGRDTYSYGITGNQLLFDGFKSSYDIAAAEENIKSAQYNYEVVSSNLRLRLRTAFIELLKAQKLLRITENISERRKQNVELVKLRYEAGREHKGSLLSAQADLAQAEFEVTQAKRNIDLVRRRLTKEIGRTRLIAIRVKGNFEIGHSYPEKPDLETLSESNPFFKELIAQKEAARFGVKSARADFFPEVYASASAGRSGSDWPPDEDEWSAGVSLSFPLFEGARRIAEVSRSQAVFSQVQADERSGRDSVILTLEETWKELQDAIDRIKVQEKFLEAAQERAKITQVQYSTGLISFDNWTIIEDDLVRANKSFLDTRTNALIARACWVQAKGGTLDYDQE